MPRESIQQKLGRVRAPRVHITYDVETGGAMVKRELPFVVGVLADLAGHAKPAQKLKDRHFTNIDRDEFDQVLAKTEPRLALKVNNTLRNDGSQVGADLQFKSLQDFQPENVARQIPELNKLLELRGKLSNLRSSLYGNDELDQLLQDVVQNTEALQGKSAEKVEKE